MLSKKLKIALFSATLCFSSVFAQQPAQMKNAQAPKIMMQGKETRKLDYTMSLEALTHPGTHLAKFKSKNLMIYYFSSKCPHCIHAYPSIQKIAKRYAPQGLQMIAIAIQANEKGDIRTFINDQKVDVPTFQDSQRKFGETFGLNSIPRIFLVNTKGEIIHYPDASDQSVKFLEDELGKRFGMFFKPN